MNNLFIIFEILFVLVDTLLFNFNIYKLNVYYYN